MQWVLGEAQIHRKAMQPGFLVKKMAKGPKTRAEGPASSVSQNAPHPKYQPTSRGTALLQAYLFCGVPCVVHVWRKGWDDFGPVSSLCSHPTSAEAICFLMWGQLRIGKQRGRESLKRVSQTFCGAIWWMQGPVKWEQAPSHKSPGPGRTQCQCEISTLVPGRGCTGPAVTVTSLCHDTRNTHW